MTMPAPCSTRCGKPCPPARSATCSVTCLRNLRGCSRGRRADPRTAAASDSPAAGLIREADVRDLVLVFDFRVAAEHELERGEHAVFVEPDLGAAGLEAQQPELRVALALLVPGCDEGIPQPVDDGGVGVDLEAAMNG